MATQEILRIYKHDIFTLFLLKKRGVFYLKGKHAVPLRFPSAGNMQVSSGKH